MATKKSEIFAKAKEADEAALKATNPKTKEAWQKIAENYRTLAKTMAH